MNFVELVVLLGILDIGKVGAGTFKCSPHSAPLMLEIADSIRNPGSFLSVPWDISHDADSESVDGITYKLEKLARTGSSAIWLAISGNDRRVIKYTNNCENSVELMNLLDRRGRDRRGRVISWSSSESSEPAEIEHARKLKNENFERLRGEFIIMRVLGSLPNPLVPRAYALSAISRFFGADVSIMDKVFGKPGWTKKELESDLERCSGAGSYYQGLLQEYVGPDLRKVFTAKSSLFPTSFLRQVLMMGRRLVGVLWRLHDLGVVHGDIHAGNIAFKFKKSSRSPADYDPFEDELVLIDFGYHRLITRDYGTGEDERLDSSLNEKLLSPWHLRFKRIGRRDDLFRLMETLSDLLYRFVHGRSLRSLFPRDRIKLISAKMHFNYFSYIYSKIRYNFIPKKAQAAMEEMSSALKLISSIKHVDDRPPYEAIIVHFERAILYATCGTPSKMNIVRQQLMDLRGIDSSEFGGDLPKRGIFDSETKEVLETEKPRDFVRLTLNEEGELTRPIEEDTMDLFLQGQNKIAKTVKSLFGFGNDKIQPINIIDEICA